MEARKHIRKRGTIDIGEMRNNNRSKGGLPRVRHKSNDKNYNRLITEATNMATREEKETKQSW